MSSMLNTVQPAEYNGMKLPQIQDFVYPILQVWYYNDDKNKGVVVADSVSDAVSLLALAFELPVSSIKRELVCMVDQYQRGVYIMSNRPTIH